jgi:hypothetical protein
VSYTIENALFEWEEGEANARRSRDLDRAARIVVAELRRRLGGSFTLDELADLYGEGTDWAADVLLQAFDGGTESRHAINAGFYRYARLASDYAGGRRREPDEERR